jgi:2,3-bisphosphoglycerate-independent phosphoglycerate mutase
MGARVVAVVLALVAALGAWRVVTFGFEFNDELQLQDPAIARSRPAIVDPRTPRLSQRVILVMVDGLRLDHSRQLGFDTVRARGIDGAAGSHYPTVSRPNYITLLTGTPPIASGIRHNRVRKPIRLDSIMTRAKAAGLRVTTASDIGNIPPLFITTQGAELGALEHPQVGDLVTPAAGYAWPFDEVRKADSLAGLEQSIATVLSKPSDLVIVLAGDVDRAGHAYGAASVQYREAAVAMGAAIGRLVSQLDLTKDTLIITADHGHVDRGGHGGPEPETTAVPLLIAGAGIVPGAQAPTARLADLAPTISALLGIPAPGHAYGRTLVELLREPPAATTARITADVTRLAVVRSFPDDEAGSDIVVLVVTGGVLVLAIILAVVLRPAIAIRRGSWVGVLAFLCIVAALVAATRGRLSPSEVPALWRLQRMLAVCGAAAIAIQVISSWHVARAFANRLSISNGISLVALSISLGTVFIVRGYLPVPHVDVPEPAWLVAIPAVEIAAAVSCVAVTLHLIFELVVSVRGTDDHGR